MSKRTSKGLMIINAVFLLLNALFLAVGVSPEVNFIAGIFCLGGLMASYMLYNEAKE